MNINAHVLNLEKVMQRVINASIVRKYLHQKMYNIDRSSTKLFRSPRRMQILFFKKMHEENSTIQEIYFSIII